MHRLHRHWFEFVCSLGFTPEGAGCCPVYSPETSAACTSTVPHFVRVCRRCGVLQHWQALLGCRASEEKSVNTDRSSGASEHGRDVECDDVHSLPHNTPADPIIVSVACCLPLPRGASFRSPPPYPTRLPQAGLKVDTSSRHVCIEKGCRLWNICFTVRSNEE